MGRILNDNLLRGRLNLEYDKTCGHIPAKNEIEELACKNMERNIYHIVVDGDWRCFQTIMTYLSQLKIP